MTYQIQKPIPRLDTVGKIAERFGVPVHRVVYIVHRRHINPAAYAGRLRLFDRAAVDRIREELDRVDSRRGIEGGVE